MAEESASELEERILLLAPTKKDAAAAGKLFASAGLTPTLCEDVAEVCSEMRRGRGWRSSPMRPSSATRRVA
jgi:hypothetical protein